MDFHSKQAGAFLRDQFNASEAYLESIAGAAEAVANSKYQISKSSLKRAVDITIAAALIFILLPAILMLAVWIRLDSPGPVIYRQRRTGLAGQPFTILKLRTMRVAEDCDSIKHACRGDDRVTRIGAVLRRTSIDELPQLFNVLAGDMSLVGPRPHALSHDLFYGGKISEYGLRFRCRPGITGLAQVSGFRGEIRELADMQGRVSTDNIYVENWSMYLDLKILLATVPRVFFDSQAY